LNFSESNRLNALQSTGPRTAEGKTTASRNALRHGGYSEAILVLGEDQAEFDALRDGMADSLNPIGHLEENLVDRLATIWWRMERVGNAIGGALKTAAEHMQQRQSRSTSERSHVAFLSWTTHGSGHLERLGRYETQLEKSFFRLLHELERLQGRRMGQGVLPPVVVDVNVSSD